MREATDFKFGENWLKYLQNLDDERIEIAERSLLEFMNLKDFAGRTFLDIGCGSGLFSYAAHRLGAERVVSFDIDPMSVECCRFLRSRAGEPDNWEVTEGSALDREWLSRLGTFDIVYSWGVLHHTGRMWDAIRNSAELVGPGGLYYIALYNRILRRDRATSSIHTFWTKVKRFYNAHPRLGTVLLEYPAMAAYLGIVTMRGENPVAHVRNYKSFRGMSWRTDATDWIGGYPYEYATVEEVFGFVRGDFPDFNLANLQVTSGRGLNWFLFEKAES